MTDFAPFSKLISQRFKLLAKEELFITVSGDALWEHYLASFPEGENPIYKERTEHDCNCCRNFIRNLGNTVAMIDGELQSVWGISNAEYPYDIVSASMNEFVLSQPITGLFRSEETSYGAETTNQLLEGGSVKRWNHLYSEVYEKHRSPQVDKVRGDYCTTTQVFKRGLDELSSSSLQVVLELIEGKALYRGEEHKASILAFKAVQENYAKLETETDKVNFIWVNANNPAARFRNTAIGTLMQDLSEGKELEVAVKMFESKVAPENYKRTTALISASMVKDAMKTIGELGLEPALERRYARISDVSINNVLWVDNSVKSKMLGGIESLLMNAVPSKAVSDAKAEDISIEEFMTNVLPVATSIEMLVKNSHQNNFMSLTAPVHASSNDLFKWGNSFGWSYDGNITDSLRQRVAAAGGRVDGVLRFSHSWNYEPEMRNASLMDLHVFMPSSKGDDDALYHMDSKSDLYYKGPRVGWNCRKDLRSGGSQDVDYTTAAPAEYVPVENIAFPSLGKLIEGTYVFKIHNWALRSPTLGGFKAEIEFEGKVFEYEYRKPLANKEWITVATAELKDGRFSIHHFLPASASSKVKWGIGTETFVKVTTLMYSPNYWDDNKIGNKHWFFTLEGCKNPESTRGIYNEFLNSNLEKHRKVFEVLGAKTHCPFSEDQLSGLGFSSTRGDSVTVKVKGPKLHKTLNINF